MPLEKPPPLNLPGLEPRETLRAMLEASDRKDQGKEYTSPISEIDFMALDELTNRIDSGALALGQVPDPGDVEKLVAMYWRWRDQFNLELQMGIVTRPRRKKPQSISTVVLDRSQL